MSDDLRRLCLSPEQAAILALLGRVETLERRVARLERRGSIGAPRAARVRRAASMATGRGGLLRRLLGAAVAAPLRRIAGRHVHGRGA